MPFSTPSLVPPRSRLASFIPPGSDLTHAVSGFGPVRPSHTLRPPQSGLGPRAPRAPAYSAPGAERAERAERLAPARRNGPALTQDGVGAKGMFGPWE